MTTRKVKTEHAGAKNGRGYWGTREEAKSRSDSLRREDAKQQIRAQLTQEDNAGQNTKPK